MLIEQVNRKVRTEQKFVCVSRSRRFGKSMAADMLAAYYGCEEDTAMLFDNLKIATADSYKEHLNKYDVIKVNVQEFLSATKYELSLTNMEVRLMFEHMIRQWFRNFTLAYNEFVKADLAVMILYCNR